jgi:hypothetical protein
MVGVQARTKTKRHTQIHVGRVDQGAQDDANHHGTDGQRAGLMLDTLERREAREEVGDGGIVVGVDI